jgi:hypothetical protein
MVERLPAPLMLARAVAQLPLYSRQVLGHAHFYSILIHSDDFITNGVVELSCNGNCVDSSTCDDSTI